MWAQATTCVSPAPAQGSYAPTHNKPVSPVMSPPSPSPWHRGCAPGPCSPTCEGDGGWWQHHVTTTTMLHTAPAAPVWCMGPPRVQTCHPCSLSTVYRVLSIGTRSMHPKISRFCIKTQKIFKTFSSGWWMVSILFTIVCYPGYQDLIDCFKSTLSLIISQCFYSFG